jgi:phosphoribosylaminoimidazolecarboxamide formyltransferase/IMP cyclohydrolase
MVIAEMEKNAGVTSLGLRFRLARKAFEHTAVYDRTIADFLASKSQGEVEGCYNN